MRNAQFYFAFMSKPRCPSYASYRILLFNVFSWSVTAYHYELAVGKWVLEDDNLS